MHILSRYSLAAVILITLSLIITITALQVNARVGLPAPEITNTQWLNSTSLHPADLRGKVVLVKFWTFGCYNCKAIEPYVKKWHETYADKGLIVIAVHSPEFDYERSVTNVKQYIQDNQIRYAVPIDNDYATWKKFQNRYWPTLYLVDKQGVIQNVRIGEGGYAETERRINELLAEQP